LQPQLFVDIDREKAKALGVAMNDLMTVLQVHLGSFYVNDFNQFGRTWQVTIQAGPPTRNRAEDLGRLKVRNAQGEMVPLSAFVAVRDAAGVSVVDRLDMEPMLGVGANPAPGVSLIEARKVCETLAEEVRRELQLPAGYRLRWGNDFGR
jgi:multidrug efflux pump subunit AcrB